MKAILKFVMSHDWIIGAIIIVSIFTMTFVINKIKDLIKTKAGAKAEYNLALSKCKDCINFGHQNPSKRLLYCMHGFLWLTPEQVIDCKFYEYSKNLNI